MKSGNEYTRKDLQKLACTLGMLYLNQPDSNILLEGIRYEGASNRSALHRRSIIES